MVLSFSYIQFYETLKNVLRKLHNTPPFHILHQYKTNSPSSLTKITILCRKNNGKKDRKDQALPYLSFWLICNWQCMKRQKGTQTCSLSINFLPMRQRKVS